MPRMGRLTIEDFESLFELSARAIAVLNLLAEVIVEVRRKQAEIWTTVRASSPLRCSSDPDEITDYLLDSVGAEARLAELRNYFIELVRRERPSPGPIAQA
jgi:hypothetical protein